MLRWTASRFYTKHIKKSQNLQSILKRNVATGTTTGIKQETLAPEIPDSADVVIIGGGSAGCNALYQLSKRGVRAVLVTRSKLTSGTTWHTAGLIWRLRPNDVEIELLHTTRDLLVHLKIETGLDPGWINNGGLYLANNVERLNEYRRLATIGHTFGIESFILNPEEVKKKFPLLRHEVIQGGLYCPGDGVVDPAMLCTALTKAAVQAGARVIEHCSVKKILTEKNDFGSKQVSGVETSLGVIKTKCVLNCGGVWSREIVGTVGLELPLVPMQHAYVITESIPGVRGLPNVRDHDQSIYFRVQGESLCMGGYESNPCIIDKVDMEFDFGLYELDWVIFSAHMQGAVKLVPCFHTCGIKSTICGPESFTPDHKPIIGEDPRLFGLYHSCGYNSAGMMLGGGCGEQIAKWIIHGRPDLHMFGYDIRRYMPELTKNKDWIKERSHESYTNNYKIVFPHDEPLAGRNYKSDPFHDVLLAEGCVFEERQGWERPGWFSPDGPAPIPPYDWYGAYGTPKNTDHRYENLLKGDYTFGFTKNHHIIGQECLACRETVAMFDMSYFGKYYLSGPEAQKTVDWLFTANMQRPMGHSVYTCLLNNMAGVEGDVTVSSIETGTGGLADPIFKDRGFYVVAGGMSAAQTWAHMNKIISQKNFKVALTEVTDKLGVLSVQGPNSRTVLENLIEADLSDSAFPYSTTQLVKVAGHLCRAIRMSFVGELGWELHIPYESCLPVYTAIWERGKKHGLRHAGYRAINSLSLETGYHLWHSDLRIDDNPIQAGLAFTCREEGDYVGKTALAEIKRKGITRRLAFLQLLDQVPLWGLESIWRDGERVGYLRRGEYGYALGASIGHGYITHPEGRRVTQEFLQTGHYQVEVMGKRYDTNIYLRSPFDPHKKRPRGIYDEPLPIRK